ncbi:MAG: GDP-L-fucose synthase [Alphaproteobacteria bacterium]
MTDAAETYSLNGKRVWVAGHRGLVGSALVKRLDAEQCELITVARDELDLRRQADVEDWLSQSRPEAIFVAAATVGGIQANDSRPADFLYDNMMIEANIIHGASRVGVEKLLFLGSTCIYPKFAPQPIAENDLLTGPLEPTNQWYALAKITGIFLCQAYRRQHGCNFISAMPTNLFGPGDYFDAENSHVIPALMGKIYKAHEEDHAEVEIWGSGEPYREFLYSDDAADALVFLMKTYSGDGHVNVGTGDERKIIEIAQLIADIVGYRGDWRFDASRQDGSPRKLADNRLLNSLGWAPRVGLRDGLQATYEWYRESFAAGQFRA